MPSVEEELVEWMNARPTWQKMLFAEILASGEVSADYARELSAKLVNGTPLVALEDFTTDDLPASNSSGSRVELLGVGPLENINALATDQSLTFAQAGLSVIYGDNGSGKSGYARLIKDVVAARHQPKILPNAFDTSARKDQSALISFRVDGVERQLKWPEEKDVDLSQVHFYDEACGDDYIANDTELSYRPSALLLFDRLIAATDVLRDALDAQLSPITVPAYVVPGLEQGTASAAFMANFTGKTTDAAIDNATDLPEDHGESLARLVQLEARLSATDQAKERRRLEAVSKSVTLLADHLERVEALVGVQAAANIEKLAEKTKAARQAADLASQTNFTAEPLGGVGSQTWRILWDAAESYSRVELHHEHIPATEADARCPLCQQTLETDGRARLDRFRNFVHDETSKSARSHEDQLRKELVALREFEIVSVEVNTALQSLKAEDGPRTDELQDALGVAGQAKARIGQRLRGESEEPSVTLTLIDLSELREYAVAVQQRAEKIDAVQFAKQLNDARADKRALESRIILSKHREPLKVDAARQREVDRITKLRGSLGTQLITKQSVAMARTHVTALMNDRFARESEHLGLNHVMLGDKGGGKGQLRHRPALLGATSNSSNVHDVLSEGEQTALGLAGVLTEIEFDSSISALVLDDPITSLDHGRREKVARRVAQLASSRQVIVFTHDLTFLGDLVRAAEEVEVTVHERTIEKDRQGIPGQVVESHPWKGKGAKQRIGDLRESLAKLKKSAAALSGEEYDQRVGTWAGQVSECWERIVRNDVVGKVVDRGTTEVKPRMIKLLAKITEEDNTDFQTGYGEVSKWAARHDKSEEVNYVAPTADEMELELDRLESWYKRVVKYSG